MGVNEIKKLKEEAEKPKKRKFYRIPPKSEKRKEREKQERALCSPDEDRSKEAWFKARRRELTGYCHCGCGQPSQKNDNKYFRFSCCHIFPKSKFESVMYHPDNFVERAFWGGCHTNMDERGMDRWPIMADWPDIVMKFHILSPLLTDEERSSKFFSTLESLVHASKEYGQRSTL